VQQVSTHKFKEFSTKSDDVHYDGTHHGLTNMIIFAS